MVPFDSSVGGLDVGRLERRLPDDQGVHDDAERPYVDFVRVACPTLQDFRCDVVGRSTDSPLLLAIKIELGGETKVSQLDLHLVVEEQIAELEIPVDYTVRVQVLERMDDLLSVALDFELMQALTPLQELIHTLVLAELEEDVHIFAVLEEMQELGHVRMLDRPVNFDFAHELLLGPASLQRGLLDNFGRAYRLRVHLHELVAFGEAALAKELALDILTVADLTICVLYAFLDELCSRVAGISSSRV